MIKIGLQIVSLYQCNDLVTYRPTVWWDTPGFSQATITNVKGTGDQDYNIQFHLDDGYDSSFLFKSSAGKVNAEYTDPKTDRLQVGPGWSTISGAAKPVDS
ncbi:MAG: hypothetical protein Q9201_003655 [Fulgogasparrea decipioides]